MSYSSLNYPFKWLFYRYAQSSVNLFTDRWQRVKINTTYSPWTQLLQGVSQGLYRGPILFNFYINDIFFCMKRNWYLQLSRWHNPVRLRFKLKMTTIDVIAKFWASSCLIQKQPPRVTLLKRWNTFSYRTRLVAASVGLKWIIWNLIPIIAIP